MLFILIPRSREPICAIARGQFSDGSVNRAVHHGRQGVVGKTNAVICDAVLRIIVMRIFRRSPLPTCERRSIRSRRGVLFRRLVQPRAQKCSTRVIYFVVAKQIHPQQ
ncbi:MAG: hypothetical protein U0X87_04650 [Anaerolineales bacterium]